jgi:predicted nucleotidyltransferase
MKECGFSGKAKIPARKKDGMAMKDIPRGRLQEIASRLANEFHPEQIILFGSHAWGAPHSDSDLDLMVIVDDSPERPIQRAIRAHLCLKDVPVPKDIIVRTRREYERLRHAPCSLENRIFREGKIVYGG